VFKRIGAPLKVLATTCALLGGASGCAEHEQVTPEVETNLMTQFRNGDAYLDCGFSCQWVYVDNERELARKYAAGDWKGLALQTMELGPRMDIAYFYLGRAAQELGYYQAAERYYARAAFLTEGKQQPPDVISMCRSNVRADLMCGGIDVPSQLLIQFQLLRRQEAQLQEANYAPQGKETETPEQTENPLQQGSTHGTTPKPASRHPRKPKPVRVAIVIPQNLADVPIEDPPPARR